MNYIFIHEIKGLVNTSESEPEPWLSYKYVCSNALHLGGIRNGSSESYCLLVSCVSRVNMFKVNSTYYTYIKTSYAVASSFFL